MTLARLILGEEAARALEVAAIDGGNAVEQHAFVGAVHVLGRDAEATDRRHAARGQQVADVRWTAHRERHVAPERLAAGGLEGVHQRIFGRHEIGWPAIDRLDRGRPWRRVKRVAARHLIGQPPRGLVDCEAGRETNVDAAGRPIGDHAESLAAFDLGDREARTEGERPVGLDRQRRCLQRGHEVRELGDGVDAAAIGGAGMGGAAGNDQAHAMEATAPANQLGIVGMAQQRAIGRPVDRREIGPHATEPAGMLVGIEQKIDAAALDRAALHKVAHDMGENRHAHLRVGGAAAPQAAVRDKTRSGRTRPQRFVAERRGVDAGVEAKDRTGRCRPDTTVESHDLAALVLQEFRLEPLPRQPLMRVPQHRLGRIDAGARRQPNQVGRQGDDTVDGNGHTIRYTSAGCSWPRRPHSWGGGGLTPSAARSPRAASNVSLLVSTTTSSPSFMYSLPSCSKRWAMFTVSPTTVKLTRPGAPILPTMAGPVCSPMRTRIAGFPAARRRSLSSRITWAMASAARMAAAAWSGEPASGPHTAITESPIYLSMMPCSCSMQAPTSAK